MGVAHQYYREPVLAWSETDNDLAFRRILRFILILFIVLGLVIPFLPLEKIERKQLNQVNPRLAQLITQKQQEPKPVTPPPQPEAQAEKQVAKKPLPKKTPKAPVDARKQAEKAGLVAMSQQLDELNSLFSSDALQDYKPVQKTSRQAEAAQTSSIISQRAQRGSGGIDTANLSKNTEQTALAGRQRSDVQSSIPQSQAAHGSGVRATTRTPEEIELVFDQNKNALQLIYQRYLRRDPTLQGKVVIELSISASGQVTACKIVSSELRSAELEKKLLARIKSFRFSAKNGGTVTVTKPLDFLPS